jgi:hypothetical protein
VPGAARIWDYWMGGKDHYEADREAGSAALELYDMATMAKQSRQFDARRCGIGAWSASQWLSTAARPPVALSLDAAW